MGLLRVHERAYLLSFVLLLMAVGIGLKAKTVEALTPAQCKEQRRVLVNACKPVLYRRPPSAFCCERLRVTDVSCVCPVITPKLAPLIDVNYAISVIQGCGRRVPPHFKCGSKLSLFLYILSISYNLCMRHMHSLSPPSL